ncbi:endonuclease/exonuclease/phosphatase family protein [Rubrivirga sp. IMCC43871]|uniref:endonuclease/exonuclease/phosphatase family protein n=1 Tax=Rubrivirga sp. IMCC43871 TaxID=3391575 RepID=UPI00398FC74C
MRRLPLLLLALSLTVAGCDSDDPVGATADVRVMTQNLYLGADLFLVAGEPNPNLVPVRVAELYGTVTASDPASRMAAIAAEIVRVGPDLVGLQEVSTYSIQSPGDNLPGQAATPATEVTIDFLDLLMDAIAASGGDYRVVSVSNNADVELPATTDGATFFDVRYQDADVILARAGVTTSNPTEQSFQTLLTQPVGGVDQTFVRGYQTVDATVAGLAFTFINTHLEVGGPAEPLQVLQAGELLPRLASTTGPVIFVGDINSNGNANGTSYQTLTGPLTDAVPAGAAPTCCQDDELRNEVSALQTRIDVVFYRGFDSVVEAEVVLDEPADRVNGIWPSDHAGVWAELRAVVL